MIHSIKILAFALVVFVVATITFIFLYIYKDTSVASMKINQVKTFFFKKKLNYKKGVMDLFDAIIYTNLDSRPDRRYQIESELLRVGFPKNKLHRNPGVLASFGALGCSMAILNALEKFEANANWQRCLFVEDDLLFPHSALYVNEQLSKFLSLNLDWDILMLGSNTIQFQPTIIDFLVKIIEGQTTAAFAVNRKFLPVLLANVREGIENLKQGNNSLFCIDMYWKKLQSANDWFTFTPPLCHQRDGYSNIENKIVVYEDKKILVFKQKKIEFLILIKTCLPRLKSNKKQLEILAYLADNFPIDYIFYYGNPEQKEDALYNEQSKILTVKTKDDYLSLPSKVGSMFKFLFNFIQCNDTLNNNLAGILMTDDDIDLLNPENFYSFLNQRKHNPFWGKIASYTKDINLSRHIIEKCKISKSLQDLVRTFYPLLETIPISVPKVTFVAGGCLFLNLETLLQLCQLDSFFTAFPTPENLKYHLSLTKDYYQNLNVFDDTNIALALQSIGIYAKNEDISKLVFWE